MLCSVAGVAMVAVVVAGTRAAPSEAALPPRKIDDDSAAEPMSTSHIPRASGPAQPRSIGVAYPSVDIHPNTEFQAFNFSGAPGYLSHFWITSGLAHDKETLVRYYVDGEVVLGLGRIVASL